MSEWIDASSRVERAQKLYQQGRWVEAAAELRAAIEVNPCNASWFYNLGLTLEALEDFSAACDAFQGATDIDSDDIEALNRLGVNLTRIGRYAESLECFEKIEKLDPTYEPSYCNRVVTYSEFGQHDEAELMFYMAQHIKEDCPLCFFNIGSSLYSRGQYDRAIDCWKQTLRIDPVHRQAHAHIGDAYWAKGDLENAKKYYQLEVEIVGDDDETNLDLGEVLLELGELEEAEKKFSSVIKKSPDNAAGFFCMGELAEKRKDLNTAECCYRKTLQLDAKYRGAHAKLAKILFHTGHKSEGMEHLQYELGVNSKDPMALQDIGELLIEAQMTDKAHKVLSQLVELNPRDAHARHNLAVSCFLMDNMDEGIAHCRKALKINPHYSLALYNLSLAYMQKGQLSRAKRYITRAVKMSPGDENIQRLSKRLGVEGFWPKIKAQLVPRRKRNRNHSHQQDGKDLS
ncbi:MAG: tetratricopeptide repeat protein [Phycisphaerae bacterium]|nr:tetratricopeptide repeat protein [Phycisphaerae bacterium]